MTLHAPDPWRPILAALLAVAALARAPDVSGELATAPGNRLFRLRVTFQDPDAALPWRHLDAGRRSGYAFRIASNRLVATEQLVRHATLIECYAPRSGTPLPASIVQADPQANVALLLLDPPNSPDPAPPGPAACSLAPPMPRNAPLAILRFDDTADAQTVPARFLHAAVRPMPDTPYPSLLYEVLADQDIDGQGAPVLHSNQLAGVVLRYDSATRIATVLPSPLIDTFLSAALTPPYQGFPAAGVTWEPLVDPVRRAYLGADAHARGVHVLSVVPGSGSEGVLQPGDVILAWDSFSLDAQGFYQDPHWGRLLFPHLVRGRRRPGDSVNVDILRDRTPRRVSIPLAPSRDRERFIPLNPEGNAVDYLIEGGLILRPLDGAYLRANGQPWQLRSHPRLVHMTITQTAPEGYQADHPVILSRVLPDPVNIGYQDLRDCLLTHANDSPVRSLDDLFLIRRRDGVLHTLRFYGMGIAVALDRDALPEANARIAATYRIPRLVRHNPSTATPVTENSDAP